MGTWPQWALHIASWGSSLTRFHEEISEVSPQASLIWGSGGSWPSRRFGYPKDHHGCLSGRGDSAFENLPLPGRDDGVSKGPSSCSLPHLSLLLSLPRITKQKVLGAIRCCPVSSSEGEIRAPARSCRYQHPARDLVTLPGTASEGTHFSILGGFPLPRTTCRL